MPDKDLASRYIDASQVFNFIEDEVQCAIIDIGVDNFDDTSCDVYDWSLTITGLKELPTDEQVLLIKALGFERLFLVCDGTEYVR